MNQLHASTIDVLAAMHTRHT